MSNASPCIHIVEDDDAVRESLQMLLESKGKKVAAYPSAEAFLEVYSPDFEGCLVLDIRMPGMSGLELQKELILRNSILPILFVTGHGDVPMAVEAMRLGAIDFVQKPYREAQLFEKIDAAIEMERENRDRLEQVQQIQERMNLLTPREYEVMELLVEGKLNKVIAGELEISQRTVEIHRAKVMEKLEAPSLAHLVRMAVACGITNS